MKYQFFLREQPKADGKSQSYLVIVPANSAEAMAQTTMQALITRHQMHTCVNLPFGNGYKVSFRLSYAEMDGFTHPLLIIISNEYGAFKLPFEAGRSGYLHFHQTYNQLKVRLMEHHNRKLHRLANQSGRVQRIASQNRQASNHALPMAVNGHSEPPHQPSGHKRHKTSTPRTRIRPNRRAANESDTMEHRGQHKKNHQPKKATTIFNSSPAMNLLKWTVGGMLGTTLLIVLIFGASSALAGESEVPVSNPGAMEAGNDFNGFPVPKMNLPLIVAKKGASCSVPGLNIGQLSGLSIDSDDKKH